MFILFNIVLYCLIKVYIITKEDKYIFVYNTLV